MSATSPLTVGILVSGRGSNMLSILRKIDSGELPIRVGLVISNKPDAPALEHAQSHGVPSVVINHKDYRGDKPGFEAAMDRALRDHGVSLVVLAGFMRLLSPNFVRQWAHQIINIHPSLLPAFPGLNAQQQALDAGVKISGCTVHFVDEGTDTGPIIAQRAVPVRNHDTDDTLSARILCEEHSLYPLVLRWYSENRISIQNGHALVESSDG